MLKRGNESHLGSVTVVALTCEEQGAIEGRRDGIRVQQLLHHRPRVARACVPIPPLLIALLPPPKPPRCLPHSRDTLTRSATLTLACSCHVRQEDRRDAAVHSSLVGVITYSFPSYLSLRERRSLIHVRSMAITRERRAAIATNEQWRNFHRRASWAGGVAPLPLSLPPRGDLLSSWSFLPSPSLPFLRSLRHVIKN